MKPGTSNILDPPRPSFYDLGLEADTESMTMTGPLHPTPIGTIEPVSVKWPPTPPIHADPKPIFPPPISILSPLPLRVTNTPQPHVIATRAARVKSKDDNKTKKQIAADVVAEYLIGSNNMDDLRLPGPIRLSLRRGT